MPRTQGTSRKGKPGKKEREAGMGKALQRAQVQRYRPKTNGRSRGGGMSMQEGVTSIGMDVQEDRTKSVLELHDLDDFLQQADLANRDFLSEREGLVVLDETGQAYRQSSGKTKSQILSLPSCRYLVDRLGMKQQRRKSCRPTNTNPFWIGVEPLPPRKKNCCGRNPVLR